MIVSVTIIRYPKRYIFFAFLAMAVHKLPLLLNRRCTFYKLMGSGKNGKFDLKPDLQQWALLAVWETEDDFNKFYTSSFISKWWAIFSLEKWTVLCDPVGSHGLWDKQTPFGTNFPVNMHDGPIAVLTRATIRPSKLKEFWSNVDKVSLSMNKTKGYILSFGIGEVPFYKQATFSIWNSMEDMKIFAYKSAEHEDIIKKTRRNNWYSEELFARFKIIRSMGTLHNADPLQTLTKNI